MSRSNSVKPQIEDIKADEIFENNSENIIKITESKARLSYREHESAKGKSGIFTYLGLFLAFAAPLVTSDFKPFLSITADAIFAIFAIASILSACMLIKSTFDYVHKDRFLNENSFIADLKGQERPSDKTRRGKIEQLKKAEYERGYRDALLKIRSREMIHNQISKTMKIKTRK